jgi:hypothetical protein
LSDSSVAARGSSTMLHTYAQPAAALPACCTDCHAPCAGCAGHAPESRLLTESPISRAFTCARRPPARCGAADGETARPGDGALGGRSVRNIVRPGEDARTWDAPAAVGAEAPAAAEGSTASCGLVGIVGVADARGYDCAEERGAGARDGALAEPDATERWSQPVQSFPSIGSRQIVEAKASHNEERAGKGRQGWWHGRAAEVRSCICVSAGMRGLTPRTRSEQVGGRFDGGDRRGQ